MSKQLLKSTSVVSSMTFISRILGFVRDMLVAQIFGVNASVDAFLVAFRLPNLMRSLFAEGSFSQAFVPTLAHYREHETPDRIRLFLAHLSGCLIITLLIITLAGILFMPAIVHVSAPGFDAYRAHLAIYMSRITFGYLMLISLTAFVGSILNSYGKFAIPAFTPALLNICLIMAALFLPHYFAIPIESQAFGVLAAGFVQLVFQLPYLKKLGFFVWPRFAKSAWQDAGVRRVLKLMLPAVFGASIVQIGILINTIFASFLATGSITWLYFSERLAYFPQGVFGVALATVVLPHLARQHSKKSASGFRSALDWGIRCNLLIGVPAALVMAILAGPLLATLFEYGRFHAHDVVMARQSVIAYAVGLVAFMLLKTLSTGFYARQDVKTPVKIGIIAVCANIILNALFIKPLAHAGLALATSLSSCFNALALLYLLHKRDIFRFQPGWLAFGARLLFANVVIAAWLYWQEGALATWHAWPAHLRVWHLAGLLTSAIILYFFCLWLAGLRLKDLRAVE